MKAWVGAGSAALAALACAPACAQRSVMLYGVVDTGVEFVSHANAAGQGVVRMPGITGELPSRWGLRGNEALGGGYLQGAYLWHSAHAQYTASQGGGGTTPAPGMTQFGVLAGIRHPF